MSKLIDLTGQRFGRLTVVSRTENTPQGKARWDCQCECGKKASGVIGTHLRSGHTISCGCVQKEGFHETISKHNQSGTRIYEIWAGMKKRTTNANRKDFKYYGERGVEVCSEWENDFEAFYGWALQNGYANNLTLDRKDNNKGYSPDNCRWISQKEQCNNKRNNRIISYNRTKKTLSEWSQILNIDYNALAQRLYRGWSAEKAFTTPTRKRK